MTRHDVLTIAIRVGALWLVFNAIALAAGIVWSLTAPDLALLLSIQVGFLLLTSVVLWRFSSAFAFKLLPEIVPGAPLVPWSKADVQDVLFRVLGMFLLGTAVGNLVQLLVMSGAGPPATAIVITQRRADMAKYATLALFGLGLRLGKGGLSRVWEKVKNPMGEVAEEDQEEELEETEQPRV